MARVLVTGAGGFIGSTLCPRLEEAGFALRIAGRTCGFGGDMAEVAVVGDINGTTDWMQALDEINIVVHLAARVHNLGDGRASDLHYYETNTRGTERLAVEAARCGVSKFIFLSTVKVNGEGTADRAYASHDEVAPQDAYGRSKWLAEEALRGVGGSMQAVIVRPPLVYGPGVGANFLRLMRCIDRGLPLPLGSIRNTRSMVNIWNLCDLLLNVIRSPRASGTWMVSDGEDLSTPALIKRLAHALDRSVRLLPMPAQVLRLVAALSGKKAEFERLCGSLSVDISRTRDVLGWRPPVTVDEALARTAAWYRSQRR